MFKDGWLLVNGVQSHVLTWGGWVDDPLPEGGQILVFMCGVPGITLFYHNFLESLHQLLKIPVWTISIAGHELPPETSNLHLPRDTSLYNNLEAQISHKSYFIKHFVPNTSTVHLLGHSFGAKMVIELMKDDQIRSQVGKCILLMPTLERFKDTPRAKFWLTMAYSGIVMALTFWVWFLHNMPPWLTKMFAYMYLKSRGLQCIDEHNMNAMTQLCHPSVFSNVQTLVWDELKTIDQLDIEVITILKDRLKVYFAADDNWAPLSHYNSLQSAVPGLSMVMLDKRYHHAFSLYKAKEMAQLVTKDFVI